MNYRLALLLILALTGCGSQIEQKKGSEKTYVVQEEPLQKRLFFSGTIQPLRESTLTSPLDAVVETIHYRYGQQVKKGDLVFTLHSNELQKQYNTTLTEYLKAKDSYTVAQAKFRGTEELWHSGLLAKNNFLSEKSSLATARMSLLQATQKLREMLENTDEANRQNVSTLSLAEVDKVRRALSGNHNLIRLKAPTDGVLLYPPKSNETNAIKLQVGSTLKSGQVAALVGDLTGISVEIDIPEVDIDKIHPGMPAKISGIALGKQVLDGSLVAVNAQAMPASGGALSSFSAVVEVKVLNELQRSWIKVGMSAAIEIIVDHDQQLLVPIAALKQEKGQSLVKLQDKNGATKTQIVTTGTAQADKVVITSGLAAGDVVIYD